MRSPLVLAPVGPAGAGVIAAVTALVIGPGRTVKEIGASSHATARDLLTAVVNALAEAPGTQTPSAQGRSDSKSPSVAAGNVNDLLAELEDLQAASKSDVFVVVAHPQPKVAHQLFGILRDEVWETRLTWILITTAATASEIVQPPPTPSSSSPSTSTAQHTDMNVRAAQESITSSTWTTTLESAQP